ncbi:MULTISPECIES: hypothetical protein [unclassified Mesorhizobium]|uniref:hypothetical protein n=1 Tax=unclassified Mesorhizobium TaxID=325217 RepID=UPI00112D1ED0|nr:MULTISPECIES: hypothetical protein [unclassified Mesorhizobium]MBZ9701856.1 hypothetical protein [Mesorhizobium sp. CO1-1-3]MBZ9945289.1 hypothetical protein [Mesorhizobium sp. BR1-1-11]TPJ07771.1 hypothetical protein FJ428_05380 [Mesorhizobium sp. B2-8-1]
MSALLGISFAINAVASQARQQACEEACTQAQPQARRQEAQGRGLIFSSPNKEIERYLESLDRFFLTSSQGKAALAQATAAFLFGLG